MVVVVVVVEGMNSGGGSVGGASMATGMMVRSSPFTVSQWQELEHQALIFKYLMAGLPVPPDLVLPIQKSFESMSSRFFHHPTSKPTSNNTSRSFSISLKTLPLPHLQICSLDSSSGLQKDWFLLSLFNVYFSWKMIGFCTSIWVFSFFVFTNNSIINSI